MNKSAKFLLVDIHSILNRVNVIFGFHLINITGVKVLFLLNHFVDELKNNKVTVEMEWGNWKATKTFVLSEPKTFLVVDTQGDTTNKNTEQFGIKVNAMYMATIEVSTKYTN